MSGCSSYVTSRDSSARLIETYGFSVVAPTSRIDAGLHRRQQRVLLRAVEAVDLVEEEHGLATAAPEALRAPSTTLRTSASPAATADSSSSAIPAAVATSRAIVVLPHPGGPTRTMFGT